MHIFAPLLAILSLTQVALSSPVEQQKQLSCQICELLYKPGSDCCRLSVIHLNMSVESTS